MEYVADFETTTDVEDCRVWAWAVCEIGNTENITYGNSIETFLEFCETNGGTYWFHNLAFDGEFILHHILTNGYTYEKRLKTHSYNAIISASGKFYQMKICFERKGKKKMKCALFKDSFKKLPFSVANIAKSFDLEIRKLDIDYNEKREVGHVLTQQEIDYITNDVKIIAQALDIQFNQKLTRLTIGSDALHDYKGIISGMWDTLFPTLSLMVDGDIRKAYRGGWVYVDERRQGKTVGKGSVYDVNSLYPYVMYTKPLPVGVPLYFKDEYVYDPEYPLYIQFLTCHAKLKDGYLPTLQVKNNPFYNPVQYIKDTEGIVDLALTNVDLDILNEHYDVTVIQYNGGYKFHSKHDLFKQYIDHWIYVKQNNTGGIRQLAKLMLNSLYGKFATNPDVTQKRPYLKENGAVGYKLAEQELRDPVYTAMGCFITAYAREKTIRTAQSVYDRFLYADTDSIHIIGHEPVENLLVDDNELGYWAHEADFKRARYVRPKTYIEEIIEDDGSSWIDVKCAGLPSELRQFVTFDNFRSGLKIKGKLRPNHVSGGIVLEETTFTML